MKIKSYTLFFLLFILKVNCYSQTFVSTNPENKNAILEEFTGLMCTWCPDGHKIANEIKASNPDDFFAINIHEGYYALWPNRPDYTTPSGNAIANLWGVSSWPIGVINRGNTLLSRGSWASAVNSTISQSSYVNVAAKSTIDIVTRELTVEVEAYFTSNGSGQNNVNIALLQNNVEGYQYNASLNPGQILPNGNYNHTHMLRNMITGISGDNIALFSISGSKSSSLDMIEIDFSEIIVNDFSYGNFSSTLDATQGVLNGLVASRTGTVIEDVSVTGFDSGGNEMVSTLTDSSGNFSFTLAEDMTLEIEKDFVNDRTVTVRDALDALKLSIGMTKSDGVNNPLDFLAADMNQDGKVSVRDSLDILKYSLKMDSSPAQWKFIPDDLDTSGFSRLDASYDGSLDVQFYDLQSEQNIVGILVGDVNGTF